jgi:hypothetical protein
MSDDMDKAEDALEYLISRTVPLRSAISPVARKQRGAVRAIRAALRAPGDGWVSVKERLPETFGACLIYYVNYLNEKHMAWGFFNNNNKWAHTTGGYGYGGVTHWRPLPLPPEITNDNGGKT